MSWRLKSLDRLRGRECLNLLKYREERGYSGIGNCFLPADRDRGLESEGGVMHIRRSQNSRRFGLAPALLRRRFGKRAASRELPLRQSRLQFEQLEPRLALAGVVINEFLALNVNGIRDQDNDRSDWIEIRNTDTAPVNIGGWYLADSVDQWQFPSITLSPNQHLLVWASGKNRAVAGQELHTNFQLSGDGESLKLLMPDGVTLVHGFDPYPAQVDNVSYGLGTSLTSVEPLVDETEPVRVEVPTSGALGTTWTETVFDDSGWTSGVTGVGYERRAGRRSGLHLVFRARRQPDDALARGTRHDLHADPVQRVRCQRVAEPRIIDALRRRVRGLREWPGNRAAELFRLACMGFIGQWPAQRHRGRGL